MPFATPPVCFGKGNSALKRRVAIIGMVVAFLIGAGGMFAGMSLYVASNRFETFAPIIEAEATTIPKNPYILGDN